MHSVIANAALHRKSLRDSKDDDLIALTHSTNAFKYINRRLSSVGQNLTDEMLGAVLGVRWGNVMRNLLLTPHSFSVTTLVLLCFPLRFGLTFNAAFKFTAREMCHTYCWFLEDD